MDFGITGGRYSGWKFVAFAVGLVVLALPVLVLFPVSFVPLLMALAFHWFDWRGRDPDIDMELSLRWYDAPSIPRGEEVLLDAYEWNGGMPGFRIEATARRIYWARLGPTFGADLIAPREREVEFADIRRVERHGDELHIWSATETFSTRLQPRAIGRRDTTDEWYSLLQAHAPNAEFKIITPPPVRNSRLLRPTIVVGLLTLLGIPYAFVVWAAIRKLGWL